MPQLSCGNYTVIKLEVWVLKLAGEKEEEKSSHKGGSFCSDVCLPLSLRETAEEWAVAYMPALILAGPLSCVLLNFIKELMVGWAFLSLGPITPLSMESYTGLDEKTLNWSWNEASMSIVNSKFPRWLWTHLCLPLLSSNSKKIPTCPWLHRALEAGIQMDKNVPICCPQNRLLFIVICLETWFLHEGTITWRCPCNYSLFFLFLQIVETLFNAPKPKLELVELKPGSSEVIVYVTQLTLGKCLRRHMGWGDGYGDLISWNRGDGYQIPSDKCS